MHPPWSGWLLLQTGQRDGRPWLWNVRRGACSQAKNTILLLQLPTTRWSDVLGARFTRTASRWLLLIDGISGLFLHFALKLIERKQ
jgi:hypothetical protein